MVVVVGAVHYEQVLELRLFTLLRLKCRFPHKLRTFLQKRANSERETYNLQHRRRKRMLVVIKFPFLND